MKILQYYDQNHNKKRGILNYKDLKITSTLQTGEKELTFSLPHKYAKDLVNEGYIRTKEDEYVIKNINSSKDYDFVSCNLNLEELEGNFFDGFDSTRNTIDKCIQLLIAGTGWTCEVIGDINKKRTIRKTGTLLEILTQIKSTYLVEIEFDSLNKVIKVYDEIGSDKGAYMMDSINLDEIQVDADSYGFATKIVAYGAVDEETQMPISVTVTNNEYSNKVISLMWKDERYTILEHLKEDAEAKLSEICKPRKAYYTHVYDLAKMSPKYHLLSYSLGDTITLISKDLGVKEKQRIVKITEYPNNPENNVCEISNRIYTVDDILQSQIDTETTINNITSTNDKISPLAMDEGVTKLIKVDIQQLNAVSAKIGELIANKIKADVADIDTGIIGHLLAQKIETTDLKASNIKFDIAEGGTLSVKDLLTKFLSAGSTETLHLTAGNVVIDDAVIKSAMIDSVSADKIKAGTLDANNVTLLAEKEGYKLVQTGRLFQWFKRIGGNYVLIAQLGFDASNKFTFAIKDESGTYTVYDEKGITEHAVPDQLIVNDMVSDSANINGKKLNIDSLITEINDNDTKTIKGSKILIDSTGQTIDVSFDTLSETVNDIGESTKTIQTDLKVEQGKVEQLIKDTTITEGDTSKKLKDAYNEIKSTVDGTVHTISSVETKINNLKIGTKNLFRNTLDFSGGDSIWKINYAYLSEIKLNDLSVIFTDKNFGSYRQIAEYEPGKEYTFSFYAKADNPNVKLRFYNSKLIFRDQDAGGNGTDITSDCATNWKRYSVTFRAKSNEGLVRVEPINIESVGGNLYIAGYMLEEGNVMSSYSQSPYDIKEDINALNESYESVKTSYNEIKTTVDGTEQTISEIETKVNKNTGDIETASNKINEIKTTVDGTAQTISKHETKLSELNATNLQRGGAYPYLDISNSLWNKIRFQEDDIFGLDGVDNYKWYRIVNKHSEASICVINTHVIKAPSNKKISVSFNYHCNDSDNTLTGVRRLKIYILQEINNNGNFDNLTLFDNLENKLSPTLYKNTFTLDSQCTRFKIRFDLENNTLDTNKYTSFWFRDITVVNGSIPANEWSPSFEDLQGDIDVLDSSYESVKKSYNEIKTTVDGTAQTISEMETKINKNTGDIETASNKINEIKSTVDGTVQTVSSVENKINNLNTPNLFKAGGGKYLSVDNSIWIKDNFKSGDTFTVYGSDTNKFYRIYNASDNNYIYVTNNTPIKAPDNKKISISFWYYCNNAVNTLVGIKNIRLYILQELNESGNFYNANKMAELNKTLTAQQYKGTFELDENCTRYKIRFDLGNGTLSNGAKTQFVFKDVAVVDGLIPSNEWTPSFEDVQSDIDVVGSRVSSCEVKTTDEYFSVQVQKNQNRKFAVRYIRDYCNGSSVDANYCNWIEIKAINSSGVNVALNKTLTSNISITNASVITNNIYENKSQFATGKASNNTIPYVQIDLGKVNYDIDEIKVWHYYSDARRYHKTKTEISADGSNWITLFDSDVSGEYVETQYGHSIKVNGDSFNSSQVVINELGLHVHNGAMDISNKAGDKVFEADTDGNLKITGVMEQRNPSTKYLATSLNNNGLGIYNYAENGDLTGGIVSVRGTGIARHAFVFCDEGNYLDLGYRTGGTENDFGTGTFVSCLSVLNKGGENDPKVTIAAPTSYEHVEHHKKGAIYMYDDKRTYFMDGTKMNDDKIRVVRTMADSNSLAYVMNGFYSRIRFQVKKDGDISDQMILGTDKIYVTSDFSVTGTKNRVVHTERYGYVNQSAYETCSPYFGDIMRATINEDGYCAVIIEDVFKETVNTKYQYEVCILGVYGNLKMTDEELKNLWCRCIDQQEDHFLLRGTPGAQVGIEVKALQRGYEGERLSKDEGIEENVKAEIIEQPSANEEEIEMPVIDDTESESILEAEFKTEESINDNNPDNKNTNDSDIIIQEDNSQYIKEGSETKGPENNTSIDNLFFDLCSE